MGDVTIGYVEAAYCELFLKLRGVLRSQGVSDEAGHQWIGAAGTLGANDPRQGHHVPLQQHTRPQQQSRSRQGVRCAGQHKGDTHYVTKLLSLAAAVAEASKIRRCTERPPVQYEAELMPSINCLMLLLLASIGSVTVEARRGGRGSAHHEAPFEFEVSAAVCTGATAALDVRHSQCTLWVPHFISWRSVSCTAVCVGVGAGEALDSCHLRPAESATVTDAGCQVIRDLWCTRADCGRDQRSCC